MVAFMRRLEAREGMVEAEERAGILQGAYTSWRSRCAKAFMPFASSFVKAAPASYPRDVAVALGLSAAQAAALQTFLDDEAASEVVQKAKKALAQKSVFQSTGGSGGGGAVLANQALFCGAYLPFDLAYATRQAAVELTAALRAMAEPEDLAETPDEDLGGL
jgi:hypothetical protein